MLLPRWSRVKSLIPAGIIRSVSIAVMTRLERINIRLDMERIINPPDYRGIFIFANQVL
jgi:hypothetical protein